MKENYLKELRTLLDTYVMEPVEKEDIIADYNDMYDHWQEVGMSDEQVEEKLGKPEYIIGELTEGYHKKGDLPRIKKSRVTNKIIALSPFAALIIFFVLGFAMPDGFTYSWVAFLLIPITAIVLNMAGKDRHVFTALSPFAAVITYGILGFYYDLWDPGWLIFLIIPVIAIVTEAKTMKPLVFLTAISPFVTLTIYILVFGEQNLWNPGWLVFLAIPALGALNEKNPIKLLLWELFILGGAGLYLYIGMTYDRYDLALFAFVPLVLYAFYQSDSDFNLIPRGYRVIVIITILIYLGLGLLSTPL